MTLISWITILLLNACQADVKDAGWDVVVRGKVGFPLQGKISIQELLPDGSGKVDTIKLNSQYSFAKKVHLTHPGYYQLNFYNKQLVNVILSTTDIEVNVDGNNQQGFVEVKGSADQALIQQAQSMAREGQSSPELIAIESAFQTAVTARDEKRMVELQNQYMEVLNKSTDKLAEFLDQQPASLGLINLLQSNLLDRDKYYTLYSNVASKVGKAWPASVHVKEFVGMVGKMLPATIS